MPWARCAVWGLREALVVLHNAPTLLHAHYWCGHTIGAGTGVGSIFVRAHHWCGHTIRTGTLPVRANYWHKGTFDACSAESCTKSPNQLSMPRKVDRVLAKSVGMFGRMVMDCGMKRATECSTECSMGRLMEFLNLADTCACANCFARIHTCMQAAIAQVLDDPCNSLRYSYALRVLQVHISKWRKMRELGFCTNLKWVNTPTASTHRIAQTCNIAKRSPARGIVYDVRYAPIYPFFLK